MTYTEGVANDGAVILRDGLPMPVGEVVRELNRLSAENAKMFAVTQQAIDVIRATHQALSSVDLRDLIYALAKEPV